MSTNRVRVPSSLLLKFGQSMATVIVGSPSDSKTYTIDQELLSHRSLFFAKALNGPWKESEDRTVTLPSDDSKLFDVYLHALHTGTIPSIVEPCGGESESLAYLFVFTEKLQDTWCKNLVMDAMVERVSSSIGASPSSYAVRTVYEGTPGPCPARRFCVDAYLYMNHTEYFEREAKVWPQEFLVDMTLAFMKGEKAVLGKDDIWSAEDYHH